MKIWFDMDGTIADLYSVEGWLEDLHNESVRPYMQAKVLWNMSKLARLLNKAQRAGHEIGIISWTAKSGTPSYNAKVMAAKYWWLDKHLHSVNWDTILVVPYGTSKIKACGDGILFDDEDHNRAEWGEDSAFTPDHIMEILSGLSA
jgi:hypothetical protein